MRILKFSASWCAPCKQLAAILEGADIGAPVESIDIDDHSSTAVEYGVRSVPHMVLLSEDNNILGTMTGVHSVTEIQQWVSRYK